MSIQVWCWSALSLSSLLDLAWYLWLVYEYPGMKLVSPVPVQPAGPGVVPVVGVWVSRYEAGQPCPCPACWTWRGTWPTPGLNWAFSSPAHIPSEFLLCFIFCVNEKFWKFFLVDIHFDICLRILLKFGIPLKKASNTNKTLHCPNLVQKAFSGRPQVYSADSLR